MNIYQRISDVFEEGFTAKYGVVVEKFKLKLGKQKNK